MSKQEWHVVKDVKAFLAQKGTKREGPHQMTKRILSWPYCSQCGLVALRNELTAKALRKPCVTYE